MTRQSPSLSIAHAAGTLLGCSVIAVATPSCKEGSTDAHSEIKQPPAASSASSVQGDDPSGEIAWSKNHTGQLDLTGDGRKERVMLGTQGNAFVVRIESPQGRHWQMKFGDGIQKGRQDALCATSISDVALDVVRRPSGPRNFSHLPLDGCDANDMTPRCKKIAAALINTSPEALDKPREPDVVLLLDDGRCDRIRIAWEAEKNEFEWYRN